VEDSPVTITVMMARTTSLIAWKLIGLKPMVVVAVPRPCTLFQELDQVLAIIGVAGQHTALGVRPST